MDKLHFHLLAREAISQLGYDNVVMDFGNVDEMWESLVLPLGYEKPSKEEFEAKLQELTAAQPLKELRTKRNQVLSTTDIYAITDYPHSNLAVQQEWLDYRQTLRDLPSNGTAVNGGNIKLWVTNQNGPLQAGDSLVLSNTAGYFTKGVPAVVTIKEA